MLKAFSTLAHTENNTGGKEIRKGKISEALIWQLLEQISLHVTNTSQVKTLLQ